MEIEAEQLVSVSPKGSGFLNFGGHANFGTYALAYEQAYEKLIEPVLQAGDLLPDFQWYPILFLYRQYLELVMKHIVSLAQEIGKVEDKSVGQGQINSPRLKWLLETMQKEVANIGEAPIDQETAKLVLWFDEMDETSQGFRYSFGSGDKPKPFFGPDERLDVFELVPRMNEAQKNLTGLAEMLTVGRDHLQAI